MKTDKLQPSDVAKYFPYQLKAKSKVTCETVKVLGLGGSKTDIFWCENQKAFTVDNYIPLLFSPEILTQTITFRGKQVCHLIELAKIAFKRPGEWKIVDDEAILVGTEYSFIYAKPQKYFVLFLQGESLFTAFQADLFAYLNWALVDYMGLGERGLCEYVDLENTPYAL